MTNAPYTPPGFRERVGAGRDLSAGSTVLAHRAQVARVRAREDMEPSATDRHGCYPNRTREADEGFARGWLLTRLTLLLVTGLAAYAILKMATNATTLRAVGPELIAAFMLIVAPVVWWKVEDCCTRRRRAGTGFTRRNRALTKVSGGGGWRR